MQILSRIRNSALFIAAKRKIGEVRTKFRIAYAKGWSHTHNTWRRFRRRTARYRAIATVIALILLVATSFVFAAELQNALDPLFPTDKSLEILRSLMVGIGGALVGATAIASSIVVFSMQSNIERMPHGLFRKLSSDWRLLGAFATTYIMAIVVAACSLFHEKSELAVSILSASWGVILILVLFLYAYQRGLFLINPSQQLALLVQDARRDMKIWQRRARRAAPLLETPEATKEHEKTQSTHDLPRIIFFQHNPHWTAKARQTILHAMSLARHYGAQGDYEVSDAALNAVVTINAAYIEAKGKTFFADHMLSDTSLTTDGFINYSLEHLRQNVRIGLSRGDEQQIEQTLRALALLVPVYLAIDYSDEHASKTHAQLSASYLSGAVESVAPHDMADVLIEGLRRMCDAARLILVHGKPNDAVSIIEKIGLVASYGIVKENYHPVMQIGVDQLARLTFDLFRIQEQDIGFVASKIRRSITLVAKAFLSLSNQPILGTYLRSYYSGTSSQTLSGWLTELANTLVDAKAEDKAAQAIIRNIEQWSREHHQTDKELLLAAISRRSQLTFELMHWAAHTTKLLLALSTAPACEKNIREKLEDNALGLTSILSWVPDDKDAISFVENYQMTELLFEIAADAFSWKCTEFSKKVHNLIMSWALKGSRHQTGWAILERSMYGLATLMLLNDDADETARLKTALTQRLSRENAPDKEERDRAAREIRQHAATVYRKSYALSRIENAMGQMDQAKLRPLLEEIANLISPDTRNEPVRPDPFF